MVQCLFTQEGMNEEVTSDGSAIGLDWNAIYRELNTIQLQWNTANTGEVFNEVFSGMNTLQQLETLRSFNLRSGTLDCDLRSRHGFHWLMMKRDDVHDGSKFLLLYLKANYLPFPSRQVLGHFAAQNLNSIINHS